MSRQPLLQNVRLGPYELKNRIAMAPMTRSRAVNPGHVPTDLHVEYYAQRATAGLIISEATQVSPQGIGYIHTPGIHSAAQIAGWSKVTRAVHAEGGRMFAQLWHVGRVSHPDFHGGDLPVAPSAVNPDTKSFTPQGFKDTATPRALETAEIPRIVEDFVQAAKNAMEAGFDGVELHGANGYLIEQFLRGSSNRRTDRYGGSIANRGRFLFEIVEGVTQVVGSNKIGVRLSPANVSNNSADNDTAELYDFVVGVLDGLGLGYLHFLDAPGNAPAARYFPDGVTAHYRTVYRGTLITNNGYDRERGNAAIAAGNADLIAFGKPFISNPDLPERFRLGLLPIEADPATFYQGGPRGYVDYPFLQAQAA
ncbi:MAG: alkene reductase [Nitrosospira sp.]|nr:alkene reductase [Nitrosospira sp.]